MRALISFVFVFIFTIVGGQEYSPEGGKTCAPQPIVIQLSCNGNNGQRHPPPPPPHYPPPPPHHGRPPPPPPPANEIPAGYDMHTCDMDDNGYPINNPPGGWPAGFHLVINENGEPEARSDDPTIPMPPRNWDGRPETLGFPMPQPGTPHYNMFMCTPIPVPVMTPG